MATRNYNPKRQYEVISQTEKPLESLNIDGHEVKFDQSTNMAIVTDTGLGEEIDARFGAKAKTEYGNSVIVVPVDDLSPARELGHRYHFQVPDMSGIKPWDEPPSKRR